MDRNDLQYASRTQELCCEALPEACRGRDKWRGFKIVLKLDCNGEMLSGVSALYIERHFSDKHCKTAAI